MIGLHVTLAGFHRLEYDKKRIRKALREEGAGVRIVARALVAKHGTSGPGDYPGLQSGLLRRSIKSRLLRGELAVLVEPARSVLEKARGADDAGYPWILAAGAVRRHLVKRDDYVAEALERRRAAATGAISGALHEALVVR